MSYLYSLYDALVSINVPSDKARAVVDSMERDMLTQLASKSGGAHWTESCYTSPIGMASSHRHAKPRLWAAAALVTCSCFLNPQPEDTNSPPEGGSGPGSEDRGKNETDGRGGSGIISADRNRKHGKSLQKR